MVSPTTPAADDSLDQWLAWLEHLHPVEIDLGLERVSAVATRAGLLESLPIIITVGGTNGKGSVVATLAAIYQAAGYHTGAYTSPHLVRFNERISVAGEEASDADITRALAHIEHHREQTSLTYFEATTLAAMQVFIEAQVEVAILEVGLGGRLDAVNCWDTDCAVITSIAIDHESWLGRDRSAIAAEKVAIARRDTPLIVAESDRPVTLDQHADQISARTWRVGLDYRWDRALPAAEESGSATYECWEVMTPVRTHRLPDPSLPGEHQYANTAAAVAAVDALQTRLPVTTDIVSFALSTVSLPGRLQSMQRRGVEIVLDVAHNPAAARALARQLAQRRKQSQVDGRALRVHAVAAIMADKAVAEIIEPLSAVIDHWYCASLQQERALAPEKLATVIDAVVGGPVAICTSVESAVDQAVDAALAADNSQAQKIHRAPNALSSEALVLVFGSFYTVSEVMNR